MPDWQRLLASGRLRRQPVSSAEVQRLLGVVSRDLADARLAGLSADRRFATAYNAALQLTIVVLRAEGYRTDGLGHHRTAITTLPLVLGDEYAATAHYLDACRSRRNTVDYDGIGIASESEVVELIREAKLLHDAVVDWLATSHPELLE